MKIPAGNSDPHTRTSANLVINVPCILTAGMSLDQSNRLERALGLQDVRLEMPTACPSRPREIAIAC